MNSKTVFYILGFLLIVFVNLSSAQLPRSVVDAMASREQRYRHYLWHLIRDNWNRYDSATRAEIRRRGWEPPRPARRYDSNGNSFAITDNNSGEDFLYMHRQMITMVRNLTQGNSTAAALLRGWRTIPPPGDDDYPVPSRYTIPGNPSTTESVRVRKTNSFYYNNIEPMEDLFTDYSELREMTLGELGSRIESTIHNWLHIRFSRSESYGYRPGGRGPFPNFDERWDNSRYDWLGDTYSSHVNPVFWKIHGWVDDRIEDWRRANRLDNITWRGNWTGGPTSTLSDILGNDGQSSSSNANLRGPALEISRGTRNPVPESTFADDVQVDLGTAGKAVFKSRAKREKSKPRRLRKAR